MAAFKISAPGRIILCGEHAVMYGKEVVAASLDLRTTLEFYETRNSNNIQIDFPSVDLSLDIPLGLIQSFTSIENYENILDDYIQLLKHVQYFITFNGLWTTYPQRFSLQTFFFSLLYLAREENFLVKSFRVRLTSQLEMNAGLGSSTSFAVCLAACFIHWSCLQRGEHNEFNRQELDRIMECAMYCEDVIQNYEFTIDHFVCTNGRVTTFQYRDPIKTDINDINLPEMNILLIDSKLRLDKNEQRRKMAEIKYLYGNAVDVILNTINNISQEVSTALYKFCDGYRNNNLQLLLESFVALQININLNQTMLYDLRLSRPQFDEICSIAKSHGCAAKLTGIGGGFAFIPLPWNLRDIDHLLEQLHHKGYVTKITRISCGGVRITSIDDRVS